MIMLNNIFLKGTPGGPGAPGKPGDKGEEVSTNSDNHAREKCVHMYIIILLVHAAVLVKYHNKNYCRVEQVLQEDLETLEIKV